MPLAKVGTRTIDFWFVDALSNIGELCFRNPRRLMVYARDGREVVRAKNRDGRYIWVELDTPTEVFVTRRRNAENLHVGE